MRSTVAARSLLKIAALLLAVPALAPAQQTVVFTAADASLTPPFALTNHSICQSMQTELPDGGRATSAFTLTNAGTYALVFSVNAPDAVTNLLYVDIDSEPQDPKALWNIPQTTGFENRVVFWPENAKPGIAQPKQKNFTLAAGDHTLFVRGSSPHVQISRISLRALPAPATNLRVVNGR